EISVRAQIVSARRSVYGRSMLRPRFIPKELFSMKRLSITATLSLLGALSLPAQGIRVPATVDTLSNGLTVIVHEDHSAPIASVSVWYHPGSGYEKMGRTGSAHLFEHLMFRGSEHAPYPQFDRLLEAAGGDNNGSTTEDRTNYYENGPANAVPLMLWL